MEKISKIKIVCLILFLIALIYFDLGNNFVQADLVGNTDNATLSLSPTSGIYKANATFPVDVFVNTHGQYAVVVAAYFSYNPNIIEIVSIDTSGSVFSVEAENTIDATNGKIKITRGVPQPGINTTSGKVATLNIKGKTNISPSSDNFTFDFTAGATTESNVILRGDLGTDILSGVYNGRFSFDGIPPANVTSFTATPGSVTIALSWVNPTTDFNGVTILRKTSGYSTGPTDGVVVYDNNGTSTTDTGLTTGITYYYTAFSRDIVLNYSSGANVSATTIDSTPPSIISNLAASATVAKSVTLNWTAVGDDGNIGTASSYDIRYATTTITASNWSSATQVSGEPTPKASGQPETMVVTGLTARTTYFFAIRAIDKANNNSTLSNIVSFKTYDTADISRDYYVNSVDFGILMSYWNSTTKPVADLNQDGIVNSVDFGIMMSQWGAY